MKKTDLIAGLVVGAVLLNSLVPSDVFAGTVDNPNYVNAEAMQALDNNINFIKSFVVDKGTKMVGAFGAAYALIMGFLRQSLQPIMFGGGLAVSSAAVGKMFDVFLSGALLQ